MTIDELKARKQELMARKKYELELQERGEGDNMALFMVNEELLDVNAQLRAIGSCREERPKFGRKRANGACLLRRSGRAPGQRPAAVH